MPGRDRHVPIHALDPTRRDHFRSGTVGDNSRASIGIVAQALIEDRER